MNNFYIRFINKIKILFIIIMIGFFGTLHAEVPGYINYQGKLKNNVGTPITTAISIQFSLYNNLTNGLSTDTPNVSGPLLWTETYDQATAGACQQITPGVDGIFAQLLGICVPFPSYLDFTDEYYLGVKIGADAEATPRVPLATNPYAFTAKALNTNGEDINITTETSGSVFINTATGMQINGSSAGFQGSTYAADYSANFVDRSLVDKAYVDNEIISASTWKQISYDATSSTVYGGDTLVPSDPTNVKGLVLENHNNAINLIRLYNNNDTGDYSGSALVLKGSGADYRNQLYFGIFGNNFYQVPFQNTALLKARDKDLLIGTHTDTTQDIKFFSDIDDITYQPDWIGTFNGSGVYFNSLQSLSVVPANAGIVMSDLTTGKLVTVDPGTFKNIYNSNGSLTGDRVINSNYHNFKILGMQYSDFSLESDTVVARTQNSMFKVDNDKIFNTVYDAGGNGSAEFNINANGIEVNSTNKYFPGIIYDNNYSANFVNRSLVDKEYVDGLVYGNASPFVLNKGIVSNGDGSYTTDDFVFGSPSLADDGNNAHDRRIFFDKSKGAFRAGYAAVDEFDDLNVGIGSIALGSGYIDGEGGVSKGPIASGLRSTAFGRYSIASGTDSLALSHGNAIGANSVAFATGTANGGGSVAFANGVANGTSSVAFSRGIANGSNSLAVGDHATAQRSSDIAFGYYTTASGGNSFSVGQNNTSSGQGAVTFGQNTEADGQSSMAFGEFLHAKSYGEMAIGVNGTDYTPVDNFHFNTTDRLFSIGNGTSNTNRSNAFVMLKDGSAKLINTFDYTTDLSGTYTNRTLVDKEYVDNAITGNSQWTKTGTSLSQTTSGDDVLLNTGENLTISDLIQGSLVFAGVGGLISQDNKNLFWDALTSNLGIGTNTPSAQLHTTGSVRFANFGAGTLITDANGNLSVSSDERLKDIQGTFNKGIKELLPINPIKYKWKEKTGYDTENSYYGFSAQNVKVFIPEAVGEDNQGFLTLSDRPILAVVVNSIKEMWNKIIGIEQKTEEIDVLKLELCNKDSSYSWCDTLISDNNENDDIADDSSDISDTGDEVADNSSGDNSDIIVDDDTDDDTGNIESDITTEIGNETDLNVDSIIDAGSDNEDISLDSEDIIDNEIDDEIENNTINDIVDDSDVTDTSEDSR